jgi:hypothetical protein
MRVSVRSSILAMAAFGSLAMAAPAAWAGCGGYSGAIAPASSNEGAIQAGDARLIRVNDAQLIRVDNDQGGRPSIVGLWSIQLTAGGATVDFGYSAWHNDGTEIMNSGGHPASTGNFCLGAWVQTGPNRYHLNHFALAYDPTRFNSPGDAAHAPGGLVARINLIEDVVLAPNGKTFTGTFTQVGFDPVSNAIIPIFGATGQITGQRVNP